MPAIEIFRQTIERAQALVDLHRTLCPRGKPKAEYADILRSAVVVAVSAMDGYFHEKLVESVPRLVRAKKGRHLPGKLVQIIKEQASHEKLIETIFKERPTSHIASMVRNSVRDRTYQDVGKIEDALRIIGLDDLWYRVGRKLKIGKEKARGLVQGYVTRRHQIVHRGDFGQTKRTKNKLHGITRRYAERCVADISRFIEIVDGLVESVLVSK